MIVRPAILADLKRDPQEPYQTILWGSDMGSCPRKAILRTRAEPVSLPFSSSAVEYMQGGNVWEAETLRALQKQYPDIQSQFALRTEVWSCKCDMVIGHGTDNPVIIEHKATGDKWWNYKNNLPRREHLGQLWLYGQLYEAQFGIAPSLILFYRSWGHYAEFEVGASDRGLWVQGEIDDEVSEQFLALLPWMWRAELESAFLTGTLPPVLNNPNDGCLFNGKPSCQYYYSCWSAPQQKETGSV